MLNREGATMKRLFVSQSISTYDNYKFYDVYNAEVYFCKHLEKKANNK